MRLSQALSLWSEELTQVALGSFWNLRTAEASNKLKKDLQQTTGDVAIQYASLCNSDILCVYELYIIMRQHNFCRVLMTSTSYGFFSGLSYTFFVF